MALNLVGYRDFFDSTVFRTLETMEKGLDDPIFNLLGEISFNKNSGDTVNFTSDTLSGLAPIVAPGGDIPESNVVEGDSLAKSYFSIKDRMVVEYESYIHNKLDLMLDRATDLKDKVLRTAATLLCGQLLTNANAGTQSLGTTTHTITTADGQYLGDTDHTVPGAPGSTFSNVLASAGALEEENITALEQQMVANNVDDAGTVIPFVADTLIVPDNAYMVKRALQLTGSTLVPESANNAINIYTGGRLKVVVLKHAPRNAAGAYNTTAQYYWALANSAQLKRAVKFGWAVRPTDVKQGGIVPKFMDKNLDSSIIVFGRLVYGAPRWQGIGYSFSSSAPTAIS